MSFLQRQAVKHGIGGGLPPMPPPGVGGTGKKTHPIGRKRDYTPVYWDNYFEQMHDVKVGDNTFRVYECGSEGPVLFFLHGGGFSALSWALLSSTLSHLVTCRCAAVDLRGHGDSVSTDDKTLSAEVLSSDVGDVVKELYGDEPPPIVLIGHSMGGAIAVHTAERQLIPSLVGIGVIDVVEGTAMEALSSMQSFLRGRPKVFKSLEHAIEWCVRSGQVRNLDSARVSMVGQVKRIDTEETGSAVLEHQHSVEMGTSEDVVEEETEHGQHRVQPNTQVTTGQQHVLHGTQENCNAIMEEEEEEEETGQHRVQPTTRGNADAIMEEKEANGDTIPAVPPTHVPQSQDTHNKNEQSFKTPEIPSVQYTWRLDLSKTEQFWPGWFQGLSYKFLSCNVPKLLLLAGVDRLDKDLIIGQMQGKFQMQVLPKSGHAVHEDVPEQVAEVLATFLVRNKMATATANFERTFPGC